ncbi:MAG: hypothetical protein RL409_1168, partial [Gemmatimonadota bacterium]
RIGVSTGEQNVHRASTQLARLTRGDRRRTARDGARELRRSATDQQHALRTRVAPDEQHGLIASTAEIAARDRALDRAGQRRVDGAHGGVKRRVLRQDDHQQG